MLRNIIRNKEQIFYPDKEKDPAGWLEVKYSMPRWIVEHFLKSYSPEITEDICKGLLRESPVTIRIREDLPKEKKETLLQSWKEKGILCNPHPYLPYAYNLEKVEGIPSLEGFYQGLFFVQDVSSMLVAEVAGIRENMEIMDLCAAPGGKATHAALKLRGTGRVMAFDITEYKVRMIEENKERQGLKRLETAVWDATVFDSGREESADLVLCDVPCSGLGVMAKKPDIKYRVKKEELSHLVTLQREIIKNAVRYVKKGGTLIYSTCTINSEENENQVKWMTKELGMEVISLKDTLPSCLQQDEGEWGLQLLPGIHQTDGFFVAKLKRPE